MKYLFKIQVFFVNAKKTILEVKGVVPLFTESTLTIND